MFNSTVGCIALDVVGEVEGADYGNQGSSYESFICLVLSGHQFEIALECLNWKDKINLKLVSFKTRSQRQSLPQEQRT